MSAQSKATAWARAVPVLVALLTFSVAGCGSDLQKTPAESAPSPAQASDAVQKPRVRITHDVIRVQKAIPFSSDVVETSALKKGQVRVEQAGRPGVRVRFVRVTLKNGDEVARHVVRAVIARQPVTRVVLRGTRVDPPKPVSNCDSNYGGGCVPIASDVDCGGGSGDGPAYANGVVTVVGSDIYDLDRDGDGYGCD